MESTHHAGESSINNVPDALAERLRERAARNHRSLQRELLNILESVTADSAFPAASSPPAGSPMSMVEAVARARRLFPRGTESSVEYIRAMRDGR